MADISKAANHSLDVEEVKQRVEKVAGDIAKKMGVKYSWRGDVCDLKGGGLKKGEIKVTATDVSIELTLGMMAKIMKTVIEKEIDQKISDIVG
jgi:putative polyhydroxyalkanoate system protein